MKQIYLHIIEHISIIATVLLILLSATCNDNFNDTIKDENNLPAGVADDNLPEISFSASSSYCLNESSTIHQIEIILTKPSDKIISATATDLLNGTAAYGTDYNYSEWSSPQVITFNPGETVKTIGITPVQDTITEGTGETIFLELESPVNAILGTNSHQIIIYDDDGLSTIPVVSFAATMSYTPDENSNTHNIIINLSRPAIESVSVTVTTAGTATRGTDYEYAAWPSSPVITFEPGVTAKTISIIPIQDNLNESSGETIILELNTPVNAELGYIYSHTVTITDDDSGWEKLTEVASPRAGSAVAIQGDWLYIYGGETYSGTIINDFQRINLKIGTSQTLASNGGRAYATLVELNGMLYLFGGIINATGTLYDDKTDGFHYYDPASGTWSSIEVSDTNDSWPDSRSHHIAVPLYNSTAESIYFHGGKDVSEKNLTNELFQLDLTPSNASSSKKYEWLSTNLTSYTRSEHSAAYFNGNIYFFGGFDNGTYHNDLWKFNISGKGFEQLITTGVTIIPKRSGISMIEHNEKLYVFGGTNSEECFNDLWSYTIASNTWTKISTAPFERCFYSAVKYNNDLVIFGGYYFNSMSQKVYSSEIWQYNLE